MEIFYAGRPTTPIIASLSALPSDMTSYNSSSIAYCMSSKNKSAPTLPAKNKRARLGLVVDTSNNQRRGNPPPQIYPRPAVALASVTTQSSADYRDAEARATDFKDHTWIQRRQEATTCVEHEPQTTLNTTASDESDEWRQAKHGPYSDSASLKHPNTFDPRIGSARKQKRGFRRPSPLKLNSGISPSDRAIPIGISIPSAKMLEHRTTLESAMANLRPASTLQSYLGYSHDLKTPTIVITPAEEDFATEFQLSPLDFRQPSNYRPRSSVYSRYTTCLPEQHDHDQLPPVPPLPRFAIEHLRGSRASKRFPVLPSTVPPPAPTPPWSKEMVMSSHSREDEVYATINPSEARGMSPQSQTPTPRRSRGWWNVLTSPFIHSPTITDGPNRDTMPILNDVSMMASTEDLFDSSPADRDCTLRSAPAMEITYGGLNPLKLHMPKRSETAPGALDLGNAATVNIYRTPSNGEASAYYNRSRNCSSSIFTDETTANNESTKAIEPVWSPLECSQIPGSTSTSRNALVLAITKASLTNVRGLPVADDCTKSRVSVHQRTAKPTLVRHQYVVSASPTKEDFQPPDTDTDTDLVGRARELTKTQNDATFTPQSLSPVIEKASTAMMLRVKPSNQNMTSGEPRATMKDSTKPTHIKLQRLDTRVAEKQSNISEFSEEHDAQSGPLHSCSEEERSDSHPPSWPRSVLWALLALFLFSAGLAVFLVLLLFPFHRTSMPVEAQWLNLTGFPPLPTGVMTVIAPKLVQSVAECVSPSALWTCSAPPGQGLSTTNPTQPNFRFLIRFRNGTIENEALLQPRKSTTANLNSTFTAHDDALARRSLWSNPLYASFPLPPSTDDQIFLGRTTDNNSYPYNGEQTPFYISLINPIPLLMLNRSSRIVIRDFHYPYPNQCDYHPSGKGCTSSASGSATATATSTPHPNPSNPQSQHVPESQSTGNNDPAPPELYPFASAQPLHLFNRGQATEHYGFYTYFDRTVYLSSSRNGSNSTSSSILSDTPLASSTEICTWSQTRFLIQIWTRQAPVTTLAQGSFNASTPAYLSTANVFSSPGSFPYATTFTLDRHGGDAAHKGVYCYALDAEKHVVTSSGSWMDENRACGASVVVNPAVVPTDGNGGLAQTGPGGQGQGIDGGDGGCGCQWAS